MGSNKKKSKRREDTSNPTVLNGRRNAKPKPSIKVTAVTNVDFGTSTFPAPETIAAPETGTAPDIGGTPDAGTSDIGTVVEPNAAATIVETTTTVEKPEGPKTPSAPKKPTVPGVRSMRTRPYLAGTLIAKYGLAAGVTDAMVAALDEVFGKPNPVESRICLKNAHHAARGYLGITEDAAVK